MASPGFGDTKVKRLAMPQSRAAVGAMVLALLVAPLVMAAPAGALGPLLQVTAYPIRGTGTPGPGTDGHVNYSGDVDLITDPIGQATVTLTVSSQLGWSVDNASFSWRTTTSGKYRFYFTVSVPPTVSAQTADTILVEARYRVGTSTLATEQTTVYAEAGGYFAGAVARITPSGKMAPGTTYLIDYDIRNTGNAGGVFTFHWADPDLNSRLKADFVLPSTLSIVGFNNTTGTFRITPQGTTPGGTYAVPVRIEITDRSQQTYAVVNFTIEMQFDNLPIYQGIFPRFDLSGPYTVVAFAFLFLVLWFGFQVFLAILTMKKYDPAAGPRLTQALSHRLRHSGLVKLIGRAVRGRAPRKRSARPLRPEEIRARRGARDEK